MKTLVIGASTNPERYSNKAIHKLVAYGHETFAYGLKSGVVSGVVISTENEPIEGLDTVTLYLNPKNQEEHYNYITALKPRRVLFNPGTENPSFESILEQHGIQTERACTLVLLDTHQY